MIADTRTNAGVDAISVYRKLHVLADSDARLVIAASAGNLSVTQAALALLEAGVIVNPQEELRLRDPEVRRLIAQSIAAGVQRCLK